MGFVVFRRRKAKSLTCARRPPAGPLRIRCRREFGRTSREHPWKIQVRTLQVRLVGKGKAGKEREASARILALEKRGNLMGRASPL